MVTRLCEALGGHSFRPDTDDNWHCQDCGQAADRDPAESCPNNIFGEHSWTGHDANGLLCPAGALYGPVMGDVAKRHYCMCGASKVNDQYALRLHDLSAGLDETQP